LCHGTRVPKAQHDEGRGRSRELILALSTCPQISSIVAQQIFMVQPLRNRFASRSSRPESGVRMLSEAEKRSSLLAQRQNRLNTAANGCSTQCLTTTNMISLCRPDGVDDGSDKYATQIAALKEMGFATEGQVRSCLRDTSALIPFQQLGLRTMHNVHVGQYQQDCVSLETWQWQYRACPSLPFRLKSTVAKIATCRNTLTF